MELLSCALRCERFGDPRVLHRVIRLFWPPRFADWTPQVRHLLSRVESTFTWGPYEQEPFTRWTHGRLTLLGDAAHPMLPHMGQGANQAIEDAMALAISLRGVHAADVLGGCCGITHCDSITPPESNRARGRMDCVSTPRDPSASTIPGCGIMKWRR